MSRLRHIIATRLGMGMMRRSFYARHIRILEATVLPSMAAQTCQDFEWVIGVDIRIDDESWREITDLLAPWPHFRAVKADPFVHDIVPKLDLVAPEGLGDCDVVALTRIDDDDAVTIDFVARIRDLALDPEARLPLSIALGNGVQVEPTTGRFAAARAKSIAIGLTLISRADAPLDIYGHSHIKVAAKVADLGGDSRLIEADTPLWIHVRGTETDSGEALKVVSLPRPSFDLADEEATSRLLAPALKACGLDLEWVGRVRALREAWPDVAVDISWDPPLRRSQIKGALLRSHRHWRAKGWPTESLECVFYLV